MLSSFTSLNTLTLNLHQVLEKPGKTDESDEVMRKKRLQEHIVSVPEVPRKHPIHSFILILQISTNTDTLCSLLQIKLLEVWIHSTPYMIKTRAAHRHYWRWRGVYGSVQKVHEKKKTVWEEKVTFLMNRLPSWLQKLLFSCCHLFKFWDTRGWKSRDVKPGCAYGSGGGLSLRTGSQSSHEELHLVDKVSSLHLAPVDLFAWPSEVAPLGLLDDVALRQLFGLAAGELDQNFAAALWTVTHWTDKQMHRDTHCSC